MYTKVKIVTESLTKNPDIITTIVGHIFGEYPDIDNKMYSELRDAQSDIKELNKKIESNNKEFNDKIDNLELNNKELSEKIDKLIELNNTKKSSWFW